MQLSMSRDDLFAYVGAQTQTLFPDAYLLEDVDARSAFEEALERLEYCFQYISFSAYCDQRGQTFFSHLHSDQYAQFLYFFANSLWNRYQCRTLCDKLLSLNRTLHNVFISYKAKLPNIFFLGHPIGSIIGNADYSDFLVVFQGVTINTGGDENQLLPKLGKGLFLGTGAKIIGDKSIGDRVSIGVDAVVYDREVPDDSVVEHTEKGEMIIRPRMANRCMAQNYFNVDVTTKIKGYQI